MCDTRTLRARSYSVRIRQSVRPRFCVNSTVILEPDEQQMVIARSAHSLPQTDATNAVLTDEDDGCKACEAILGRAIEC